MKSISIEIRKPRRPTQDRYYTVEKLGAQQSLTKEGFLLCEAVPIARTGTLVYGPGETPVEAGKDNIVRIEREEDVVFHADTLASFEGKPVTLEHPDKEVTPDNFKEHVVGIVQNVRRGKGIEDDLMLADLLIHDKDAIEAVRDGMREVSCGYDADYEQIEPGRGRQLNIIGNHVALVENGRCGSRCAIQDRRTVMKKNMLDALMKAFKAKDSAEVEKLAKTLDEEYMGGMGGSEGGASHVHVHLNGGKGSEDEKEAKPFEKKEGEEGKDEGGDKMDQVLALLTKLCAKMDGTADTSEEEEEGEEGESKDAEKEEKEDKKDTKDAAARLEVLVPGTKLPVRDSKTDAKKFQEVICGCKRKALDTAAKGDNAALLKPLLTGVDLEKASAATVDTLFIAASEMVKAKNNAGAARGSAKTSDFGKSTSIADINKKAKELWAAQGVH